MIEKLYCVDCKYVAPANEADCVCTHEEAEPYRDVVMGNYPRCELIRANDSLCGINGEWYEACR